MSYFRILCARLRFAMGSPIRTQSVSAVGSGGLNTKIAAILLFLILPVVLATENAYATSDQDRLLAHSAFATSSQDRPQVTLDEAIRMALGRNPVIVRDKALIGILEARSVASGELPDPKLILGEQYFPISFNMAASALAMTTVGLRQSLPPWGKRAFLKREGSLKAKAARLSLGNEKRRLVRNVRLSWLDLYQEKETDILLRSFGGLFQKTFSAALERFREGTASESDVLSAQYRKDTLRESLESLTLKRETTLHRLMRLMHLSQPFVPSGEPPQIPAPLPERVLLNQLDTHPEIASAKAESEAQQARLKAAERDRIPSVSVEGDYSYFMGPNLITTSPNLFSVVLSFNLPVRPGSRQGQEIRAEEKTLEAKDAQAEDQKQRMEEEIRNEEQSYRIQTSRLRLFDRTLVPESRRNAEAGLSGYASGTVPMDRVLDAMNTEKETAFKALSLRIDRMKTMVELSYLSGSLQGETP